MARRWHLMVSLPLGRVCGFGCLSFALFPQLPAPRAQWSRLEAGVVVTCRKGG